MKKCIILCDIDGVVAPLSPIPDGVEMVRVSSWWGPLAVRRGVIDALREFESDPRVTLVWASNRDDESAEIARGMGVASRDFIDFSRPARSSAPGHVFSKVPTLIDFLSERAGEYDTVIWFEDDADDASAQFLGRALADVGLALKFFRVDPGMGVTDAIIQSAWDIVNESDMNVAGDG